MKQKGQGLVEFALTFPIYIFLLFALIYSGILFYDYATLTNIARESAREAAIVQESHPNDRYTSIETFYKTNRIHLITSLYQPAGADYFTIQEDNDRYVTTNITMALPNDASYLMHQVLPEQYTIRIRMHKDFLDSGS